MQRVYRNFRCTLSVAGKRSPASQVRCGITEQDFGRARTFEIQADVKVVRHSDTAVHLNRFVGDVDECLGAARLGERRESRELFGLG